MIRKAVGAIIYDKEDRYLLVHKVKVMNGKENVIHLDTWDFVKGGVKAGEDNQDAIKREIWEETGCKSYEIEKVYQEKLCFEM